MSNAIEAVSRVGASAKQTQTAGRDASPSGRTNSFPRFVGRSHNVDLYASSIHVQ